MFLFNTAVYMVKHYPKPVSIDENILQRKISRREFSTAYSFCLICCVLFIYLVTRRSLDLPASAGNESYHHLHI